MSSRLQTFAIMDEDAMHTTALLERLQIRMSPTIHNYA